MRREVGRYERTAVAGETVSAFIPDPLPPTNPRLSLDAATSDLLHQSVDQDRVAGRVEPRQRVARQAREGLAEVGDRLQERRAVEQEHRNGPQPVPEEGDREEGQRQDDHRNPEGVTHPVDGVLVAPGVLGDPRLERLVPQQGNAPSDG